MDLDLNVILQSECETGVFCGSSLFLLGKTLQKVSLKTFDIHTYDIEALAVSNDLVIDKEMNLRTLSGEICRKLHGNLKGFQYPYILTDLQLIDLEAVENRTN